MKMINDSRIMNLVKQKIIYNIFIMKNVLKNLNIIIINFVFLQLFPTCKKNYYAFLKMIELFGNNKIFNKLEKYFSKLLNII